MQEVSQGSLKLQAHHDKIANSGSQSMKNYFLQEQVYYLTQLRDHCKALQISIKPNSNITIHRINKLVQNLRQQLLSEVVATRREISLCQLPLSKSFQEKMECKYQQGVVNLDRRLQKMEELVQRQQDRNRATPVLDKHSVLNFKSILIKKVIDENLKRNQTVTDLIKVKLILASKLKEKTQEYRSNCFINAHQSQVSQRQYFSLRNKKKFYRSTTLPSRLKHLSSRMEKTSLNQRRDIQKFTIFNNFQQMQKTIFQGELDKIKCQNMKLQKSIDLLKSAISQRQNKKMLTFLSSHQELETEESKARELLFYMLNNQKLTEKIKSCSYIWSNQNTNIYPRHMFQSREECRQQRRKLEWKENHRGKVKKLPSLLVQKSQNNKELMDENKEDFISKWKQFKIQLNSHEKTNESIQCVDGDS